MIGIDVDNLDKLIKLNNLNLEDIQNDIKEILISIGSFDECYSGRDLQNIFESISNQRKNLIKITNTVKSYSTVFSDVMIGYKTQDENVRNIVNQHIN